MKSLPCFLGSSSVPPSLYLLLLKVLALCTEVATASCFYPDGTYALQDTPCSNSSNSTCCGFGYACLSNRICMATGDEAQKPDASLYVRGSCTDETWTSSNCPLFCIGSEDLLSGGMGIAKCANTTLDEYFCIDGGDSSVNCDAQFGVFEFPGTPTALTTVGVVPASTSPSSLASTTSSANSTRESDPTPATSLPTTTQTATPSPQPSHSDKSAAIGAGVGVPLGLLVVAAFAFLFYRFRKRWSRGPEPTNPAAHEIDDGKPPTYYQVVPMNQELPGDDISLQVEERIRDERHELPGA